MSSLVAALASPDIALRLVLDLCAVSLIIRTLELLTARAIFAADGCLSWALIRELHAVKEPRWLRSLFLRDAFRAVLALRLAGSVGLLVSPAGPSLTICLALVAASSLVVSFRMPVGQDGSDQMNLLIVLSASIALLCPQPAATVATLIFIAAQAVLAYTTSGLAKLMSRTWRSGQAIPQVLSTLAYGNLRAADTFRSHMILSRTACWCVMLFEAAFALAFVMGTHGVVWLLAAGIAFHVSCAVLMGLNCFFWSFAATYPAIVFTSILVQG